MMQSVRQHLDRLDRLDRLVAAGNDCLAYFEDMALAVRAALEVSPAVVAAAIRTARAATAGEDGAELTCPPASTPDKTSGQPARHRE